jgi:Spy/CpxP family protein refolding chaperone
MRLTPMLPLLLIATLALPSPGRAGPIEDEVSAALAAPEAIVRAATGLGLAPGQVAAITADARQVETEVAAIRDQALAGLARLGELLRQEPIDAAAASAGFAEVLDAEARIKRLRFALWLRSNAALSPEQRRQVLAR